MSVERGLLGSAAVIGARKRAGLTQEQLALRAGLSVRAVRDLELGRVRRPRRATLDLIAASVGFTGDQAAALHDAWCSNGDFRPFVDMIHVDGEIDAILTFDDSPSDCHHLIFYEKLTVGPDRRLVTTHNMTQIETLEHGVTSRTIIWGGDMIHSASAAFLTSVTGANLASRTVLPDLDLVVFVLTFPTPLNAGDIHTFSYDLVFDSDGGSAQPTVTTQEAAHGYRRPVGCHIMHVAFDGCPPPAHAWEIRRGTIGGWRNWQRGRPVLVGETSIESHCSNASTGVHGLLWEW